jgi:hypothetical protein
MHKIYIDSIFRTSDSKSSTDFKIQLHQPLEIQENMKLYITDINIPNTWYAIEETNKYMYVRIYENSSFRDYIITLTIKNYSMTDLAAEIQSKLNAAVNKGFVINLDTNTGKYTFNTTLTNFTYEIFSDSQLKVLTDWKGRYYTKENPKTCNNILRNFKDSIYSSTNPFVSGFVNILNYESLYIRSNISNLSNIGPDGYSSNIIKKVNVSDSFGNLINFYLGNSIDYTYIISRNNLSVLEFRITDAYNNVIDLHGSDISLTLILIE